MGEEARSGIGTQHIEAHRAIATQQREGVAVWRNGKNVRLRREEVSWLIQPKNLRTLRQTAGVVYQGWRFATKDTPGTRDSIYAHTF